MNENSASVTKTNSEQPCGEFDITIVVLMVLWKCKLKLFDVAFISDLHYLFVSASRGCSFAHLRISDILWLDVQVYKVFLSSTSCRAILVDQGVVLTIVI